MRKQDPVNNEGPLVDATAALALHSKRTERKERRRHQKEVALASKHAASLYDLPSELLLQILSHLLPSSVFALSRTCHGLNSFLSTSSSLIANSIISRRYPILTQCFPRPVLLENVDQDAHKALLDEERQIKHLHIHKKPYQHVKTPDVTVICTCLTCMLAWNNLCVIVDFAHWQSNLEQGEPIPMIPRGELPQWNADLIQKNAGIVDKALRDKLWYARILEAHLNSTVDSITRHTKNMGNKRRRFRMTAEDAHREDDAFLARSGPPSTDFPFHRDNFYMLEAYLPNRGWNAEAKGWRYMPSTQHDTDVGYVKSWKVWRDAGREADAVPK